MTSFQTVHQGRLHTHVLSAPRFNSFTLVVKMTRPIRRTDATVTAMLPYLWLEGTEQYPSALALMQRSEELYGTVLRSGVGKRGDRHVVELAASSPDESLVGANGLFRTVNELIWTVANQPAHDATGFPDGHVQRERALHRKRIESLADDKVSYAFERCVAEVCRDVPAGLPRLGYLEDLPGLTGERLWQAHEALLQEAHVHVYVVGPTRQPDDLTQILLEQWRAYGAHAPSDADSNVIRPVAPRNQTVHNVREEQPVNQGKLDIGLCTGLSCADEQYAALMVANGVLGGFPFSKLFVNVREKASLAYYARSSLDGLTGIVTIQTGIEVEKKAQALQIIEEQVKVLQQGQITPEELDMTKRGLRNQFLQLHDQPGSLIDFHFTGALVGQERTVDGLLQEIDHVTLEDVVEAAQTLRIDTIYFLGNMAKEESNHG
ncbi:MAG: insulinase family protein [Alicyclobacillus sp.]|nr:insulinase family protein [Alicyclobacillus sp.]